MASTTVLATGQRAATMAAVSAVAMVLVWDGGRDLLQLYCITCRCCLLLSQRRIHPTTSLDVKETTVSWEAWKGATALAVAEVV
jgi:hypothetical protein